MLIDGRLHQLAGLRVGVRRSRDARVFEGSAVDGVLLLVFLGLLPWVASVVHERGGGGEGGEEGDVGVVSRERDREPLLDMVGRMDIDIF